MIGIPIVSVGVRGKVRHWASPYPHAYIWFDHPAYASLCGWHALYIPPIERLRP